MRENTQPRGCQRKELAVSTPRFANGPGTQSHPEYYDTGTAQAWEALVNAALDYAERENISDPRYHLNQAAGVISKIRMALELDVSDDDARERMRLWSHRRPIDDFKKKVLLTGP